MMTTDQPTNEPGAAPAVRFVSLRWRLLSPLFVGVLVVAMAGAYLVARNLSGGWEVSQTNVLLQSSRAVGERSAALYDLHRQEAQRVAFTIGVPEAVSEERTEALETILVSLARTSRMGSVIVTDAEGVEVLGIQRVEADARSDFALSTQTDLSQEPLVRAVLDDDEAGVTGIMRTPGGLMLFTGMPVYQGDQMVGVGLVGQRLSDALNDLKGSALADLVLYGADGNLLQTTFPPTDSRQPLTLDAALFRQALAAERSLPVRNFQIEGLDYQGAYQPFHFGPATLGVVGALMPDNIPYMTETGRQLTALLAAALAGAAVVIVFAGANRVASRAEQVADVAERLALGHRRARTEMQPGDEIEAVGYALDRYADVVQQKQDAMQQALRRQRREANHLMLVLESMPDGVVVQDLKGQIVFMNDQGRDLLGSQERFREAGLDRLADSASRELGPALAPGLYALGDPLRVGLDDRMLSAQAAAVLSPSGHRLGTVVLLRDITEMVRQERDRDVMLRRLALDIQQPLAGLGRVGSQSGSDLVRAFAREVSRQAVALQKVIVDMHELANVDTASIKRRQRSLRLETLVWSVANEWRQIAQANQLTLHVIIERKGLHILGDEKRLRWAIGNIVDNAIKYTLPGGALTLEIRAETDGMANLRVRDSGVGIMRDELPHVFTRFYRGRPTTSDGEVIRVPGMGQGLYLARQIFESHGGRVAIKSKPRIGTAVYMSLPLTAAEGLELPLFEEADMDGETVRLPEDFLVELDHLH
ncbi:MAG: ATP-binding protein [Phototrophicaceae bacterium]